MLRTAKKRIRLVVTTRMTQTKTKVGGFGLPWRWN
jgi:hypothetical protein